METWWSQYFKAIWQSTSLLPKLAWIAATGTAIGDWLFGISGVSKAPAIVSVVLMLVGPLLLQVAAHRRLILEAESARREAEADRNALMATLATMYTLPSFDLARPIGLPLDSDVVQNGADRTVEMRVTNNTTRARSMSIRVRLQPGDSEWSAHPENMAVARSSPGTFSVARLRFRNQQAYLVSADGRIAVPLDEHLRIRVTLVDNHLNVDVASRSFLLDATKMSIVEIPRLEQ